MESVPPGLKPDVTARTSTDTVQSRQYKLPERVVLNIGGQRFLTFLSTLQSVPNTRLYNLTPDDDAYDAPNHEYFFDRSPRLFSYILDFYRSGEVHFPHCVCAPSLKKELEFWGISDVYISVCCLRKYTDYEESTKTLSEIECAFLGERVHFDRAKSGRWRVWQRKVWLFLEDPYSSWPAKIWAYVYVSLLVLSAAIVCLDTLPECRLPSTSWRALAPNGTNNDKINMYINTEQHPILYYLNHICSVVFGIELFVRFIAYPVKLRFFASFFNVIDCLSVIPMLIWTAIQLIDRTLWLRSVPVVTYFIFVFTSVLRAIRIVKLVKHYRGLQVMFLALKASAKEMLLLFLLMAIGIFIFSTMIYFAELRQAHTFPSIPIGFWWSVVTMTTVGYGDNIPTTTGGYIVGGLCAISGMLITGLPIPVIANNFNLYYTYARLREKMQDGKRIRAMSSVCDEGTEGDDNSGDSHTTVSHKPTIQTPVMTLWSIR